MLDPNLETCTAPGKAHDSIGRLGYRRWPKATGLRTVERVFPGLSRPRVAQGSGKVVDGVL